MDQDGLTRREVRHIKEVGPDGAGGFHKCRGIDHADVFRDDHDGSRIRYHKLPVSACGHKSHDAVALSDMSDMRTALADNSGHLQARNIGTSRRWGVVPMCLENIRPVDARRSDLNENFTRSRNGITRRTGLKQWPCG